MDDASHMMQLRGIVNGSDATLYVVIEEIAAIVDDPDGMERSIVYLRNGGPSFRVKGWAIDLVRAIQEASRRGA